MRYCQGKEKCIRTGLTRLVNWVSIMKLWTCFSARVSSNFRAKTATTSAVHAEPCKQSGEREEEKDKDRKIASLSFTQAVNSLLEGNNRVMSRSEKLWSKDLRGREGEVIFGDWHLPEHGRGSLERSPFLRRQQSHPKSKHARKFTRLALER